MKKYNMLISKLMSNIFFRIILCMFLLVFGAMYVRYSNSMISYAIKADNIEVIKQYEQQISKDNLGVDNGCESDNGEENFNENIDKYVTASLNQESYSNEWIIDFNNKIIELQKIFPEGKFWNHMGLEATNSEVTNNIYSVTDIPCNHTKNGENYCNAHYGKSDDLYPYKATCCQCRGFTSLLSDLIFGADAPVRYFEDYDELRIGDQARIDGDYHSVFIIDKTDEYVIVAECNRDLQTCQINWGRKILREDMEGWYISRWSDERSEKINEN